MKYVFLEKKIQACYIVANLTIEKEQKVVKIMRKHQEAIAWIVEDLKGISPSVCMHKIFMEENAKTLIEHHRGLNPVMKEVVKNEVLKWLNSRFSHLTHPRAV